MRFFCSIFALMVACAGTTAEAFAQAPVTSSASGRGSPGGTVAATLLPGAKVVPGETRNGETYVILEGWIDEKKLGGPRDSFPESVAGKLAMRVHTTASKNGAVIAELHAGAGVTVLAHDQGWAKVRRGMWVSAKALGAVVGEPAKSASAPAAPKAAPPSSPAPQKAATVIPPQVKTVPKPVPPTAKATPQPVPPSVKTAPPKPTTVAKPAPQPEKAAPVAAAPVESPAPTPMPPGALLVARGTALQSSPSGGAVAALSTGAVLEPIVRDRGWVKVRVEGWVNERDLSPTDSGFSAQLTASDLRADPEGSRGKIVRWEVQLLALQYADPLRRDLARDEPYFLARGPGAENALLYLAVPPSLLKDAKALAPLTNVIITARVRVGRSDPGGTAILDLRSISKR